VPENSDMCVFLIARELQDTFRTDVSKDEWLLIKNLKAVSRFTLAPQYDGSDNHSSG